MYRDLYHRFIEPPSDQYDAYYYDFDKCSKDVSFLPPFLKDLIEYPTEGSGTQKYAWMIYQLATRANLAIECGVWQGGVTVPLAMGLKQNNGHLCSIDINLSHPALKEKIERYDIKNITLLEADDLSIRLNERNVADIIFIDSLHEYEHVVKQLFLYDRYLKPGGVFILHDIVTPTGVGLVDSTEDYGYGPNQHLECLEARKHISEYSTLVPQPNCLFSPVYLAIQTFLAYRPTYKIRKILDWAGMAFIWKFN